MAQTLLVPSGLIYLLKEIPIDNTYEHTIYFSNPSEQKEYFMSRPRITISATSYQRTTQGYVTVGKRIDELINCCYMMFQSQEVSEKWYYAFITNVEYVNNITTRVYYELDVIQTWMFDYVTAPCLVVRQHTETDKIGDNLVNENISVNEYTTKKAYFNPGFNYLSVIIMYDETVIDIPEKEGITIEPGYYAGNYNGAKYIRIRALPENMATLSHFINTLTAATWGGINCIFMIPDYFVPDHEGGYNNEAKELTIECATPGSDGFNDIDGYIPQNNKLFTFPYVCMGIKANGQEGVELAFEGFTGSPIVACRCNFSPNATGSAVPKYYMGENYAFDKSVKFGPYPMCSWTTNAFVNWMMNNLLTDLLGISSTAGNSIIDTNEYYDPMRPISTKYNYNPGRIGLDIGLTGAKMAGEYFTSKSKTHSARSASSLYQFESSRGPEVKIKTIRRHQAKIIDDYFSKYGYAINEIRTPNKHARACWTYVKTSGYARVSQYEPGVSYPDEHKFMGVPCSDWDKIVKIHDNGITYWDKDSYIGDYMQLNPTLE